MGQSVCRNEPTVTRYRTIVADPPWPYPSPGGAGPSAEYRPNSHGSSLAGPNSRSRYGAVTIADLKAIETPRADDAHLYLWTTNAFVCEAHDIARAWGFRPITILTWVKTKVTDGEVSGKIGYYFRGATEHCLFSVSGSLRLQTADALPTAFLWPRAKHSAKPDAFYDLVEKASPGPYAELFARRARFGWDYPIGDQALGGATAELTSRGRSEA